MDININESLVETLNLLAEANSTTPEEYSEGVLNSHLNASLKRFVINNIEGRPAEEVASLASTLKDASIAIDDAKPKVIPINREPKE